MEENTERDEVYEQFMQDLQAKKKRRVKSTIKEVIMVVIVLGVIGFVVWFLTDPEASEKVSLRKEKEPVASIYDEGCIQYGICDCRKGYDISVHNHRSV